MLRVSLSKMVILVAGAAVPAALFSLDAITPETPTLVTASSDVNSPAFVCRVRDGFLATWASGDEILTSVSVDNGSSWSAPVIVTDNAARYPRACAGRPGILVSFRGIAGEPFVSLSHNNGSTWSLPCRLSNSTMGGYDVPVCATGEGFMATFNDSSSNNAYSAFSRDGFIWGAKVQINKADSSVRDEFATTIAGYENTFIAAWVDRENKPQTSIFVVGESLSWGNPVTIFPDASACSEISLSATKAGFMATWNDSDGKIYSSLSTDKGATWNFRRSISFDIGCASGANIGLSGSSDGFVAAWQSSDNTAFASFTNARGSAWSQPVQISEANALEGFQSGIIGVSLVENECLFTWTSNASNVISSASSISAPASHPPRSFRRPKNHR